MKIFLLKILSSVFAFILTVATAGSIYADTFSFDDVKFVRENSDGATSKWSQLIFEVSGPRISGRIYRPSISFTLDTSLKTVKRTDIRFREDWLEKRWYNSTSSTETWLGSAPLTLSQKRELYALSSDERVVLAWIITNSSELIEFALASGRINKNHPLAQWQFMNKNETFEKNLRKHFGDIPGIAKEISARDEYSLHTKLLLRNRIQPSLKKLGHYKGAIDGIIGPGTRKAIKDFERSQDIFPDGILRSKAEYNLLESAIDGNKDDLFKGLDVVAKKIKLRNIFYSFFPNESDNKITDIVLEASFKRDGIIDEFKLNGYYRKFNKMYYPNEFCLVPHNRSQPAVCMKTQSAVSVLETTSDYLRLANGSVVERTYLKCAIVKYRYDDLYEQIKDIFAKRLFEKHRSIYISAAANCMNAIVNQKGAQSQVKTATESSDSRVNNSQITNGLKEKLRNTEKELFLAERKISNMQGENEFLKSTISSERNKFLEVTKKLHFEEQTVRNLQIKLNDLEEKLKTTEKALLLGQQKVSNMQGENKFLKSTIASERNKFLEVTKKLHLEEQIVRKLQNQISDQQETNSEEQLEITEQELLSSQEQISSLKSEVRRLTSVLDSDSESYQQKIGDLENEISALTKQLETAESQITATPNKPKGFILSEEWQQYKQWITPSQMRFCNILHEYEIARVEAANSGNQLLQNMAIKQRDKDISALLTSSRTGQSGEGFRNWVSIVQSVFAMDSVNPETGNTELAAGVILETPCGISVGTGRVLDTADAAKSEFKYLAFEGDLIFSQLASVRRGDPVLFDGSFARSEAGSSEMFITNELGEEERLEAYEKPDDAPDMFVDISYLAKL